MSDDLNNLPEQDVGKNISHAQSRWKRVTAQSRHRLAGILFNRVQIVVVFLASILASLRRQGARLSKNIKSSTAIAALVVTAVLAGHAVSAQVNPSLPPLSQVKVPEPENIGDFIKDKTAAIALGKSLFWDMQLGTDGIQSCASCHFHAGADSRSKNQINPGLLRVNADGTPNPDKTFKTGATPNYQLTVADFPFHKLEDPNNRNSNVVFDSNDITGSQGVFRSEFVDVVPGSAKDNVTPKKDELFNVQGTNVRQVTGRNTPTVINAVFNFRNFWDGRAQNIFNGVSQFGLRDPDAFVLKANNPRRLEDVRVSLKNSSLASQAVGPPLSAFETFAEKPPIAPFAPLQIELSEADSTVRVSNATNGNVISSNSADLAPSTNGVSNANPQSVNDSNNSSSPSGSFRRKGRKLGKKLLALQPLAKQFVARDDSVLGRYSKGAQPGLNVSYMTLIERAFKPEWWKSNLAIRIDPNTGERIFFRKRGNRPLSTIEYTLPEYNFALFFGLAIQAYESTLISDQTPFDQFLAGNTSALTEQQQRGFQLFQQKFCIGCHAGAELTGASVSSVARIGRITRSPAPGNPPEDTGFFKIGVRPEQEDLGVGGKDDLDNPLSETRLAQLGTFQQLLGEAPNTLTPPLDPNENAIADGAFKAPGLRNVELTSPYFHNGGMLTLREVVDFYNRGAADDNPNRPLLPLLNLSDDDKEALVAFLQGLTDERVRFQRSPFDHPQLFVPKGHPGDQNAVTIDTNVTTSDGTTQAADALLEIPAVGRDGGNPLPNFLGTYSTTGTTLTR